MTYAYFGFVLILILMHVSFRSNTSSLYF